MRKEDVIAGLRGKPVPFEVDGFAVHLRPLTAADRAALFGWYRERKDDPTAPLHLMTKLIAAAVVDPHTGEQLLTEADAAALPGAAHEAIAEEVARRNGLGGDRGKARRPTPS